ncbi:iron-siderophore ABC transporter permease [Elstera litoralis]|uniref:Iron-siderophore ABC transporter permease n=1 Tax=Elstera litoralis TaxID=552518 RepID=A0A0F3IU04_9PROT|nr:iron ABC transporter permease [Elstera litoralis]KJV10225.1 iron-siderophore ABC transporter permease [Elstera litoralis]
MTSTPTETAQAWDAASVASHRARSRGRQGILLLLLLACGLSLALDIATGPGKLDMATIFTALFQPETVDPRSRIIIWDIRLPVALMALLIGSMLGLAGAQMQTILGNPLADPFTLGLSSAASVGASLAIVFGFSVLPVAGPFILTANAFVFALGAALAVFALTRLRGVTPETMILFGIALMFTFNALLGLLQYRASETQLTHIVFWMLGSLGRANWDKIAVAAAVSLIVMPLMWRDRWRLTALRVGDDRAASLGVDVGRLRLRMLVLVALLSAVAVSFVGVIGFIGLVGPHIARMLVGEDQRFFAPAAFLAGGLLMSVTSIVSKSLVPGVIYPIGIITALVGVPFFVSLILSRRSRP